MNDAPHSPGHIEPEPIGTPPPLGPPPGPPPHAPGPPPMAAGRPSSEETTLALLAHILPLVVGFWAPLIIWLVKKDESLFVGNEAKEALNFQLSILIAVLICIPLMFVIIGFFLIIGISIAGLVYSIIGGIEASKGIAYRYPYTWRMIS